MCQFFSAIITRQGDVRFCEDDSHETTITRLRLDDARPLATRGWVRVECVQPHDAVRVDETSVPGWYAEDRARYDDAVMAVACRCASVWATYQAGCASLWATYHAGCASLRAAYPAGCASLRATCQATLRTIEGYVPPIFDPRD
jgi:hypothetical protein